MTKERCVLCGGLTEVLKNQPVSERKYYMEGAGQLCRECYREVYEPVHNNSAVQLEKKLQYGGKA